MKRDRRGFSCFHVDLAAPASFQLLDGAKRWHTFLC